MCMCGHVWFWKVDMAFDTYSHTLTHTRSYIFKLDTNTFVVCTNSNNEAVFYFNDEIFLLIGYSYFQPDETALKRNTCRF